MGNDVVFNIDHFLDFVTDSPDEKEHMIALFKVQATECLETLATAHQENTEQEWRDAAHKMKGLASFAGTERLRTACETAQLSDDVSSDIRAKMLSDIQSEANAAIDAMNMYNNSGGT